MPAGFAPRLSPQMQEAANIIIPIFQSVPENTADIALKNRYISKVGIWSIECCFKVMKGMLGLGKEFQTRSYAATIASTALVITRYIILEYLHRINTDGRTLNEMCRDLYDEVPRIEFDESLQSLLALVMRTINNHPNSPVAVELRAAVTIWYIGLPKKVADILPELCFGADEAKADIPIPVREKDVA